MWENKVEAWEAKLAGDSTLAEKQHDAAIELARVKGFRYLQTEKVLSLPTESLLERVEAAEDAREATALLGLTSKPNFTVVSALADYWHLSKDRTYKKSPDQLRRWKNPRKKAVRNFVAVCGDKPLHELIRDDLLDFHDWWYERLAAGTHIPGTANKDFTHLSDVLKTVNTKKRLGLDLGPLLSELSFDEGAPNRRPPFSITWIKEKLLAKDALSGLNSQARCVLLMMVNTGARPSEITTLNLETIDLTSDVPSISVRPDGRETCLKSALMGPNSGI